MATEDDVVLPSKRVRRAPGALTEEEKARIEAERQVLIAAEMATIVEMAKKDSDGEEDAMYGFGDDFEDGTTESEEDEGGPDSVIRWTCINCTFRNFAWQDGCMVRNNGGVRVWGSGHHTGGFERASLLCGVTWWLVEMPAVQNGRAFALIPYFK